MMLLYRGVTPLYWGVIGRAQHNQLLRKQYCPVNATVGSAGARCKPWRFLA